MATSPKGLITRQLREAQANLAEGLILFILFLRYKSGEKKRLDDMTDSVTTLESQQCVDLRELRAELEKLYKEKVRQNLSILQSETF